MENLPDADIFDILLVEDNAADARLTQEIFKECKIQNRLHVVRDGASVIPYLRRQPPYENAVRPQLILLDLNLPKKHGQEVLWEIKQDPDLRVIPVIILTTSADENDVLECYKRYANSFITKPLALTQFVNVVRSIENFWLSLVRLPPALES
jgi:chemotaxis family two-component system response regulator Rcp1